MNLSQSKKLAASALGMFLAIGATQAHAKDGDRIKFELVPNPGFVRCLARFPDDPSRPPRALVTVARGRLNDSMHVELRNIKPNLAFDLFTVERSTFTA